MRNWVYILVAFAVIYLIRVLPLTLIRRPIRSRFTLAVMTVPAIVEATNGPLAGVAALAVGIAVSWFNGSLLTVAAACCAVVFVLEMIL